MIWLGIEWGQPLQNRSDVDVLVMERDSKFYYIHLIEQQPPKMHNFQFAWTTTTTTTTQLQVK